jgi:hypothetical protein
VEIIYLPGNSLDNKIWIEKVKNNFEIFSDGKILDYDHWQNGKKWIDINRENEKLEELVKNENYYNVFAKSIGTILTLKGIRENYFKPEKIIFCGFPYSVGERENLQIDECLKLLTIPVIFIQNEFDPMGNFEELEKILINSPPKHYQLIKILNNFTHDYENYEELTKIAGGFYS